MQIELHMVGTSSCWRLGAGRARIGRDAGCEVALSPELYPMVSREHAILTVENGRIHLADNKSTNGVLVNGTRTASAMLTKLDRFRLGKDGPEFEIRIIEEQPAAGAQTVVSMEPALGMPTRMNMDLSNPGGAPTRIVKPAEIVAPVAEKIEGRESGKVNRTSHASVIERQAASGISAEEEQMIEQKLNSLRNLVYLLVAMVAVLLGVIFYQSQQIDKNRAELSDMRRQAQGAVAQFTPALDQRLGAFDKRLDQVDAKMKQTEDEFMTRLNNDLPHMLDKYVDRKLKELGQALPQAPQSEKK